MAGVDNAGPKYKPLPGGKKRREETVRFLILSNLGHTPVRLRERRVDQTDRKGDSALDHAGVAKAIRRTPRQVVIAYSIVELAKGDFERLCGSHPFVGGAGLLALQASEFSNLRRGLGRLESCVTLHATSLAVVDGCEVRGMRTLDLPSPAHEMRRTGIRIVTSELAEMGPRFEVVPSLSDDGQAITLSLSFRLARLLGWDGPGGEKPIVQDYRSETTAGIEAGQALFCVCPPVSQGPHAGRVQLLLVTARRLPLLPTGHRLRSR